MQRQPGAPPHCLRLVTGALYELMRNFSSEHRLMNHSVVILKSVHEHHVCIETLQGELFPLPRICFRMAMAGSNSTMCRRQYPLRPAYAATFNGCQGTTLDRCTVDLRRCPFTHGHLYVALSRVRSKANVSMAPATTLPLNSNCPLQLRVEPGPDPADPGGQARSLRNPSKSSKHFQGTSSLQPLGRGPCNYVGRDMGRGEGEGTGVFSWELMCGSWPQRTK